MNMGFPRVVIANRETSQLWPALTFSGDVSILHMVEDRATQHGGRDTAIFRMSKDWGCMYYDNDLCSATIYFHTCVSSTHFGP